MAKLIIVLMANQGGGKGAAARVIEEQYDARAYKYSQPVRDLADLIGWEQTRENLQELAQHLRKVFGEAVLEKEIMRRCDEDPNDVAIADGPRESGDLRNFVLHPGFRLIYLEAPKEIRKARMMARGENVGEAEMTNEEFERAENHKNELAIRETVGWLEREHKDKLIVIDNSGDWRLMRAELVSWLVKLTKK